MLWAIGGVEAGGRGGRRGRGLSWGRGGRLPVLAGALGLGLDAALVEGEGVLALELQALGRYGLIAGLAGAVVAPAQLDAPAEALHDRAVSRQRELRHGAGGQHHEPRAARVGPEAGLSGSAGTAGSAPRRLPGCLTATPWPRELRSGLARGGGLPLAPLGPTQAVARCPPQASACPRRPGPIVFRAAAAAAILKLFSGLSEKGGAPAGESGVTADEQGLQPIREGRAGRPRGGA